MASYRDKRAGSLLQQEISRLILHNIKDPRVSGFVTVTDVIVSKDLRVATVYVSIIGDKKSHKDTLKGLNNAKGYIKKCLSKIVYLKYMPEIRFKEDLSLERGASIYDKISHIIEIEERTKHQYKKTDNEWEGTNRPNKTEK